MSNTKNVERKWWLIDVNSPLIKGNQWVFIVPDHKAGYFLAERWYWGKKPAQMSINITYVGPKSREWGKFPSPIYQCKGWFPHSLLIGSARLQKTYQKTSFCLKSLLVWQLWSLHRGTSRNAMFLVQLAVWIRSKNSKLIFQATSCKRCFTSAWIKNCPGNKHICLLYSRI